MQCRVHLLLSSRPTNKISLISPVYSSSGMLYLTFLSKLVGRKIHVELKSGMQMHGVLLASDNFANLSLDNPVICGPNISFTHVSGGRRVFIRGSSIQFLYLDDVGDDESLSLRALANDSRISWAKEHHTQEPSSIAAS